MERITAILNQKGGVGKTTTAHALGAALGIRGRKVLVVDCDPQGNLSYAMRADTQAPGLYEALRGAAADELIQHTQAGDIISSSPKLAGADKEFDDTGREYLLDMVLESVRGQYSHIILDCPPQLGILTINALVAATDVIITLTADIYALQGLSQLATTIGKVRQFCRKQVHIAGLLLCRHNSRSILSRDLAEVIEDRAAELDAALYSTIIREGVSIREAQARRESIFAYAGSSNSAKDYARFAEEYLSQERSARNV
jgi:chromosome partitioning protein